MFAARLNRNWNRRNESGKNDRIAFFNEGGICNIAGMAKRDTFCDRFKLSVL